MPILGWQRLFDWVQSRVSVAFGVPFGTEVGEAVVCSLWLPFMHMNIIAAQGRAKSSGTRSAAASQCWPTARAVTVAVITPAMIPRLPPSHPWLL
jgi:hypothetical protein